MRNRCPSPRPWNGSRMMGRLALAVLLLLLVSATQVFGWPLEDLTTGALGRVAGSSSGVGDAGMFSNLRHEVGGHPFGTDQSIAKKRRQGKGAAPRKVGTIPVS